MTQVAIAQQRSDFKTNQKDTLYGKVVSDPYRMLEDTSNAKVKAWAHAEAAKTTAFFNSIPGRKILVDKIKADYRKENADDIDQIQYHNGKFYVTKRIPGNENFSLYEIDKAGRQKLYMDPQKEHPEIKSKNIALGSADFIDDKRYLIYDLIIGGDESDSKTYLKNLKTGKDEPDSVYLVKKRMLMFYDPDRSDAFYYQTLPDFKKPGVPPSRWFDKSTIAYHILGTDLKDDKTIIGLDTAVIKRNIDEFSIVDFTNQKKLPYALVTVKNSVANEYRIYYAPKTELHDVHIPWKKLTDFDDKVTQYTYFGNYLYLFTKKNAPNGKVVRLDLRKDTFAGATTLVPNTKQTIIQSIGVTKHALLITATTDGVSKIWSIPHGTKQAENLPLPLPGDISIAWKDDTQNDFIIKITSWIKSPEYFTYHADTKKFSPSVVQSFHNKSNLQLEVKNVMVKSYDGVMVPMTIICKKGLVLNGSHPIIIGGYGAYGQNDNAFFWPEDKVFFEYGGIRASAHVRGGGIYGEAWRLAGSKETKPNTWKDFIACAEYLIAHKYATDKNLVGTGESAGGIMIGRAVTERPDLFGGATISVGVLDMIRIETTPNGKGNIPEFGSIATEKGFNALYEMSTYHHIIPGAKYPTVIFSHGFNDARVAVWTSLKTAALMQDATTSGNPVLLKIDFDSGHGIQSTESTLINDAADKWSFLFWKAGVPGFTPGGSNR